MQCNAFYTSRQACSTQDQKYSRKPPNPWFTPAWFTHLFVQTKICPSSTWENLVSYSFISVSNYFAQPPTHITPPLSVPTKFSTLHSSRHHPLILKSFGIPSTSFFKAISQFPFTIDSKSLPSMFASFFSDKVITIHSALKLHVTNTSPLTEPCQIPTKPTFFSSFTEEVICNLLSRSSNTFCDLDPTPTSLLNQCLPALLPTITNIVNQSLSSGVFPKQFKLSYVIPLVKKNNPDKKDMSNYRPISFIYV